MADKRYVVIAVNVSEEERDEVHRLARKRGYKITSDYLRDLIVQDAEAHGESIKFDVDRGGRRERRDDQQ